MFPPGFGREARLAAEGVREVGGIAEAAGAGDEENRDGRVFQQVFGAVEALTADLVSDGMACFRREKTVEPRTGDADALGHLP